MLQESQNIYSPHTQCGHLCLITGNPHRNSTPQLLPSLIRAFEKKLIIHITGIPVIYIFLNCSILDFIGKQHVEE